MIKIEGTVCGPYFLCRKNYWDHIWSLGSINVVKSLIIVTSGSKIVRGINIVEDQIIMINISLTHSYGLSSNSEIGWSPILLLIN